jgi:ABC-type multidrug transport system ATPase subunit
MGSSGAGKTTLLNALCDRITKSSKCIFEGSVKINDTIDVE